jgi:hypothetical protein
MKQVVKVMIPLAFLGILALPLVAVADYSQDFDGLNGSSAGTLLTGQDGYYLPSGPPGDADFLVYTYDSNALGIQPNPQGGTQFIAGTGPGNSVYARAQRAMSFGTGSELWEIWYDFCAIYTGVPPSSNNVASFSMRQAANTVHINLITWVDPNNPTTLQSTYVYYDATGVQSPIPGSPPGPEWTNLLPNHWYRGRTVVDLFNNLIVEVAIQDLSGGNEAVYYPQDWFLIGGVNPPGTPDAIRFFGGGGNAGNTGAFDNCVIRLQQLPTGACCYSDGTCQVTAPEECQGEYQGNWTDCEPNECTQPNAVEVSTWGAIKNQYHR